MKEILSVICPLYKGKKYVDSIVKMIRKNTIALGDLYALEIVFVNDYPDEIIAMPEGGKHITLINNPVNVGIHQTRINGLNNAKGSYILFLDQDDRISDSFFMSQLNCLGDADAIVCNGYWRNGKRIYSSAEEQKRLVVENMLFPYIVSPGQVLLKREAIPVEWCQNVMQYNGCDDALLWNLMLGKGKFFSYNNECMYEHVENEDNASTNYQRMFNSLKECFDIMLKQSCYSEGLKKEIKVLRDKKLTQYGSYVEITNAFQYAYENRCHVIENIKKQNVQKIAVYGYGYFGQCLVKFLEDSDIRVRYVIDRDKDKYEKSVVPIFTLEESLPKCDLIVVTPMLDYEKIKNAIKEKVPTETKIKSILEILN